MFGGFFTVFLAVAQALQAPCTLQASSALRAKNDDWKQAQMDEQAAILARRRNSKAKEAYMDKVFERRKQATQEQYEKWRFQRDPTKDPMEAWKELRAKGEIGDLKTGLGVDGEKREGGIPLPLPSFGVGGEAGVGGQYDNGERFDLRLPYVDQGRVIDPDRDVVAKFMKSVFGDKDDKKKDKKKDDSSFKWPWEK